jgi:hypothetical protein
MGKYKHFMIYAYIRFYTSTYTGQGTCVMQGRLCKIYTQTYTCMHINMYTHIRGREPVYYYADHAKHTCIHTYIHVQGKEPVYYNADYKNTAMAEEVIVCT